MAQNLLYQMKVKLRADAAQLVSISPENGQLALRFAPLAAGVTSRPLPDLGPQVRGGKNTYWCSFLKDENWQERLLETLDLLRGRVLTL